MKKITHIINGLDLGGAETALYRLLQITCDSYQLQLIVLSQAGHYSPKIAALGIPIEYLNIRHRPVTACLRLKAILKHHQPEIVQTWLYHADLIGGSIAKYCGVKKIIWGIRCEGVGLKKTTGLIKKTCALLSKHIPHYIIANSKAAAAQHIKSGYDATKMNIIYNGFENRQNLSPTITQITKELKKPITVGTLARYHPDKDYTTLTQAINLICKSVSNIQFIFCGAGCHEKNKELKKLIVQSEAAQYISLINGVEDTHAYLNTLDIFVQSSKTESFSNSLAEAMLCGLSCVATDVGETRLICGNHAIVVSKENPYELAQACLVMIKKSVSERIQLGQLARDYIEQSFSMKTYKQNFKYVYEK